MDGRVFVVGSFNVDHAWTCEALPRPGETLVLDGYRLTVDQVVRRRIRRVTLEPVQRAPEPLARVASSPTSPTAP